MLCLVIRQKLPTWQNLPLPPFQAKGHNCVWTLFLQHRRLFVVGSETDAALTMLKAAPPPRCGTPNDSGFGSEEDKMSKIVLTRKAAKLMMLCELEGFKAH